MKKEERGASLVEYALLVAMLSIASIAAVRAMEEKVSQQFSTAAEALSTRSHEGPSDSFNPNDVNTNTEPAA